METNGAAFLLEIMSLQKLHTVKYILVYTVSKMLVSTIHRDLRSNLPHLKTSNHRYKTYSRYWGDRDLASMVLILLFTLSYSTLPFVLSSSSSYPSNNPNDELEDGTTDYDFISSMSRSQLSYSATSRMSAPTEVSKSSDDFSEANQHNLIRTSPSQNRER